METYIHKILYKNDHTALFIIALNWQQVKRMSTGEWINKLRFVNIVEYYSKEKKKKNSVLISTASWLNLINICWAKETKHKYTYFILFNLYEFQEQ